MKKKLDMVRYYGQLHQHAVQPRPRDSTEISVVYQDDLNTVRVSNPGLFDLMGCLWP